MPLKMKNIFDTAKILMWLSLVPMSCGTGLAGKDNLPPEGLSQKFKDYWFQGEAEVSSYQLEQARYGEIRQGSAVLVFVTEDFSQEKQVKLDKPQDAGSDVVKVMKLNLTKKFNTGIYPYSMMQSVFTPLELQTLPYSLKVTTSSQEWCGHTFSQLNLKSGGYQVQSFSYFETEGDQEIKLKGAILEDEIWNLIRINPGRLPTGKIDIIPGTMTQRLRHTELRVSEVLAEMSEVNPEEMAYSLNFSSEQRSLTIFFEKSFPHKILGWEESYPDGFGPDPKMLTTRATLDKTLITDYWTKNANADAHMREQLNLK